MARKNERFVIKQMQTGIIRGTEVIVDTLTGVNYLFVKEGYGAGLTPLLDENGKPIVTKE